MNKKLAIGGIIMVILALILPGSPLKIGAIDGRDSYNFKNIIAASAPTSTPVVGGNAILGSVVINTVASAGVLRIYDGFNNSTSDATLATSTGTLIASFPAASIAGTYTFDVAVVKGIVVDPATGFNGNYTVTFK